MITLEDIERIREMVRQELDRNSMLNDPSRYGPWLEDEWWEKNKPNTYTDKLFPGLSKEEAVMSGDRIPVGSLDCHNHSCSDVCEKCGWNAYPGYEKPSTTKDETDDDVNWISTQRKPL